MSVALCSTLLYVLCLVYRAETGTVGEGTVRFYRNGYVNINQGWSSGIVQIYFLGSWRNICDDSAFGWTEANVICHQFSYSGVSSFTNTGSSSEYGTDLRSTVLDDVSCSSSAFLAITQCYFSVIQSSLCTDNTDVIVTCYSTRIWNSPKSGDIRLIGGTYSNHGRLEVYCNGEWGTVCDDSFNSTHAFVACNQLGYNDYFNYNHYFHAGSSLQSIWLDALAGCSAYDTCLTSCQTCPLSENHNCFHLEDVTLECDYNVSYHDVDTLVSNVCSVAGNTSSTTTSISSTTIAAATAAVAPPRSTAASSTTSSVPTAASSATSAIIAAGAVPTAASSRTKSTAVPTAASSTTSSVPTAASSATSAIIAAGASIGTIIFVVVFIGVLIFCVYYCLRIAKRSKTCNRSATLTGYVNPTAIQETFNQQPPDPIVANAPPPAYNHMYPQQPPHEYPPQEYPAQEYPAQVYPPQGYPAQVYPPQGYQPQEYPAQGYPHT